MLPRGTLKPREDGELLRMRLAGPDIARTCDLAWMSACSNTGADTSSWSGTARPSARHPPPS